MILLLSVGISLVLAAMFFLMGRQAGGRGDAEGAFVGVSLGMGIALGALLTSGFYTLASYVLRGGA